MKKTALAICITALALLVAQPAFAGMVSGHIRTAMEDRPVYEAKVILQDEAGATVASTSTDRNGRYLLTDVEPGAYKIIVYSPRKGRKIMEEIIVVEKGETVSLDFALGPKRSPWGQVMGPSLM